MHQCVAVKIVVYVFDCNCGSGNGAVKLNNSSLLIAPVLLGLQGCSCLLPAVSSTRALVESLSVCEISHMPVRVQQLLLQQHCGLAFSACRLHMGCGPDRAIVTLMHR